MPTENSFIGQSIEDLDTPSLLLDWQACERNIKLLAEFFADKPCKLRPHFKNNKCTTLARKQQAAGQTVGFTCAKVGEAEVLAEHRFEDVLIANQVVGAAKIARLVEVAKRCRLGVAVDHADNIAALSQAMSGAGVTLGVLVEVDIGMGRCGVTPGERALELARIVEQSPGLEFRGLQAFEGHLIYINDFETRSRETRDCIMKAVEAKHLIEGSGLACPTISGGSSATYMVTGVIDGVTELQAGTYPTMDWRYHEVVPEFEIALSVLARVISRRPDEAVLDVGVKGAGGEFGIPKIKGHDEIDIPFFASEEHLLIRQAPDWSIGEAVQLVSSHACTTCNLYREMFVHEDGKVVDVWPIEAAGRLS
jgi:D-serine deaminase-like pyridoxal phosphate-dependent protein